MLKKQVTRLSKRGGSQTYYEGPSRREAALKVADNRKSLKKHKQKQKTKRHSRTMEAYEKTSESRAKGVKYGATGAAASSYAGAAAEALDSGDNYYILPNAGGSNSGGNGANAAENTEQTLVTTVLGPGNVLPYKRP